MPQNGYCTVRQLVRNCAVAMTLKNRYKPKLTEWEKEKQRRRFILYTYAVVSLAMLFYFLLPDELSATQIATYTLSFLTTAESITLSLLQIMLDNFSPAR